MESQQPESMSGSGIECDLWIARDGDGEVAITEQIPEWYEVVDGWVGHGFHVVRDGRKWPQEKIANRTCCRLVIGLDVIHAPPVADVTHASIEQSNDVVSVC